MNDSTKSIFQSARRFLSGTLLSRFTGLMRDVAMAFAFGTEPSVAALMVAFRFSHFFRRLLGEGALQMAFIPHFEKLRAENPEKAAGFFKRLTTLLSLTLTAIVFISVIILLLCSHLFNFSPGNQEILFLTTLLMPGLFFICLYGMNASLLQCENRYFTASIAPIAFNAIWICGAWMLYGSPSHEAMPWLCGFIVCACAGQWLMTWPAVRTILKKRAPHTRIDTAPIISPEIKKFVSSLFLGIIGIAATQINSTIDPLFARYVDSEGPAFLWYAIRLQQFPLALFGIALSSALLPPLSRAIQAGEMDKYSHFLNHAIKIAVVLMLPMMFAYVIAGDSCVNLVFGHGDFTIDSTAETTRCLWAYTLGILPAGLTLLLAPAFYSLHDYRTPMISTCISVGANVIFNSLFVFALGMGTTSVAYATSIGAWINFLFLAFALKSKINIRIGAPLLGTITLTTLVCSVAAFNVVVVDYYFFGGNNFFPLIMGATPPLARDFSEQTSRFFLEALSFSIIILPFWGYLLPTREQITPATHASK